MYFTLKDNRQNQNNIDDIFNSFGSSTQKLSDTSLNLDFTSYTTNNSSTKSFSNNTTTNSGIFDPFGLGTGFIDNSNVPLKPLNPSQQTSKETSPQQAQVIDKFNYYSL